MGRINSLLVGGGPKRIALLQQKTPPVIQYGGHFLEAGTAEAAVLEERGTTENAAVAGSAVRAILLAG